MVDADFQVSIKCCIAIVLVFPKDKPETSLPN